MNKRIWELDAARGLALIGMMGIHLIYDLVDLYRVWSWNPQWYQVFKNNYGVIFLVISGISVTLGRHPVKRGLQVFCCGGLCTLVTYGMYRLGFAGKDIIIYIGVLQCLGLCMMLWPVFKKLPGPPLVLLAGAMVIWGLWLRRVSFSFPWLTVLGFAPYGFASSDYFPLFPNLGYFLLGAVAGRAVYEKKHSLYPMDPAPVPGLRWLGRNSLLCYLLHQPILAAAVWAVTLL